MAEEPGFSGVLSDPRRPDGEHVPDELLEAGGPRGVSAIELSAS